MANIICINEINELLNCKASIKNDITPGMVATMFVGSDRYAMVVTKVLTPKKIMVAHLQDEDVDKLNTNENGIGVLPKDILEFYFSQMV